MSDRNIVWNPVFVEETTGGYNQIGLRSFCLSKGMINIIGDVDAAMAQSVNEQIMFCMSRNIDIDIILNSPGGEVISGLAMYDMIRIASQKVRVDIYCMGIAASMGAILLAAGEKDHRFILPHSKVMVHEPLISGGLGGAATTIQKTAESILETKGVLNGILAERTDKSIEEIDEATKFDNYMNAEEAIRFGIADKIVSMEDFAAINSKIKQKRI